jgi:DNA-binding transcriptional LysR family regulator
VELRQLRLFVTLSEELNFRRAAERSHIAQPALSEHIRRMEQELGLQLFERTSHYVRLTSPGQIFLGEIRKALAQVDHAFDVAERASRGQLGTIRVGLGGLAGCEVASQVLRTFAVRYPAVALSVRVADLGDPSGGLRDGDVDVALIRLPVERQERLDLTTLCSEPTVAVMADDHPLADRDTLRMAEIARCPFVAVPRSAGVTRGFWLGQHDAESAARRVVAEARTVEELLETIAACEAVTLAPAACERFHSRPGISFALVPDARPSVLAVAHPRGVESPLARAFTTTAAEISHRQAVTAIA